MTARMRFLQQVAEQIGKPVRWAQKGPSEFDCSGLVAYCLKKVGGPDLTLTHNTDRMWAEWDPVEEENVQAGDLVFWFAPDPSPEAVAAGADPRPAAERGDVEHVAVVCAGGNVISADGATPRIKTPAEAKAAGARVRFHEGLPKRARFAGWRRFPLIDTKDGPVLGCAPASIAEALEKATT